MSDMKKLNYLVDYLQKKSEEYHLTENEFGDLLQRIKFPATQYEKNFLKNGTISEDVKKFLTENIQVKKPGGMLSNPVYGISEALSKNINKGIKKLKHIRKHGGGGDQLPAVPNYEQQEALAKFCKKSSVYLDPKLTDKKKEIIDQFYEGLENKLNSDYGDLSDSLINMNLYLNNKFKYLNQGKIVIPGGLDRVKEFWDYQLNNKLFESKSPLKKAGEIVTKQYVGVSELMKTQSYMPAFKDLIIELAKDCDKEGDIKMLQGVCKAIGYDFGVKAIKALIQASTEAGQPTSVLCTKCKEINKADPKEVIKYIVFGKDGDANSIKESANLDRLREIIGDIPSEKESDGNLFNKAKWKSKGAIRKTGNVLSKFIDHRSFLSKFIDHKKLESFSKKVEQSFEEFKPETTKQHGDNLSTENNNTKKGG
ncbi:MAG: hypothetical protein ACON5A_03605 [Candidatus Comchoanobacterales bacterium]